MAPGLLFIYSDRLCSLSEKDFDAWYGGHLADRLRMWSGILSAGRFEATDGKSPTHLAIYDVKDVNGLLEDEYKAIKPADEEHELKMVQQIVFDRRVYELIRCGK